MAAVKQKSKRGFAAMSAEKQREIASKGGRAVHDLGRGRHWDKKSAAEAGRKGASARNRLREKLVDAQA